MNDLTNAALQVASIFVTIFGSYALTKLAVWLGLKADGEARGYLLDAVAVATDVGMKRLALELSGATPEQVRGLRAEVIGEAATYVASRVPGALKRIGVDDAGVRALIDKRLPSLTASLQAAAAIARS